MKTKTNAGITRRNLLRGLGFGSVLLLPFVRSRISLAQPESNGNFLVYFTPNGHKRDRFGADGSGTSFTFRESLSALEPFKQDVAVIHGLCSKSASAKSSHEDLVKILTCVTGPDLYRGYGPSIDHVIGDHIGQRPLTLAVERFISEPNWQTKLSWRASGANDPHIQSPRAAFSEAFAGVTSEGTSEAVERLHAQNRSVLDFVTDDLQRFRGRLSAEDRAKLELHLDSMRQLERRVTGTGEPVAGACDPSELEARVGAAPPTNDIELLRQQGEVMVDLIATAFLCGHRRVATLMQQPSTAGINPAGGDRNHHQVSHYEGANPIEQWRAIDTWYGERFAYLLGALASRGILDSTVVTWVSEISENHNQNNFVNVVAGGKDLGIRTGQKIEYAFHGSEGGGVSVGRDSRNRSIADLWVSVQQAMGLRSDTFGEPEHCSGGLRELYAG